MITIYDFLKSHENDFIMIPPTPEEFLTKRCLGDTAEIIHPYLKDCFIRLFNTDKKVLSLYVPLGWGKTTFINLYVLYQALVLSCLRDPSSTYRLSRGEVVKIGVIDMGTGMKQWFENVFSGVLAKLAREMNLKLETSKDEISFSNKVKVVKINNPIGMDPMNFVFTTESIFTTEISKKELDEIYKAIYKFTNRREVYSDKIPFKPLLDFSNLRLGQLPYPNYQFLLNAPAWEWDKSDKSHFAQDHFMFDLKEKQVVNELSPSVKFCPNVYKGQNLKPIAKRRPIEFCKDYLAIPV